MGNFEGTREVRSSQRRNKSLPMKASLLTNTKEDKEREEGIPSTVKYIPPPLPSFTSHEQDINEQSVIERTEDEERQRERHPPFKLDEEIREVK
jgi:hypothetical protein